MYRSYHRVFRLVFAVVIILSALLIVDPDAVVGDSQWQTLSPTTSPGARSCHTITNVNGKILLFAGLNGVLNDTWEWERLNRNWKQVTPDNDPPPAGHSFASAAIGDKLYIFYGMDGDGGMLGNVWSFDTASNRWQLEPQVGAEKPSARFNHTCLSLPDGRIALFGGSTAGGPADTNVWFYTPGTGAWEKKASMPFEPRSLHSASFYDGAMYIFGGTLEGVMFNDMWKYTVASNTWTQVSPAGTKPSTRAGQASAQVGDNWYLFGGANADSNVFKDTWVYTFSTNSWAQKDDMPLRLVQSAAVNTQGSEILLFGGRDSNFQKTGGTLVYAPSAPLGINTISLPNGTVGSAYSQTLNATGGTAPYTWSLDSGVMPPGLSLSASTGGITGLPTTAGTYDATYKVTDNTSATDTRNLPMTVGKGTLVLDNLSSPTIPQGTATTTLGGKISCGTLIPSGNFGITLNGVTQNAAINSGDGTFSSVFNTSGLTVSGSPYTINYNYAGDANYYPLGPVNRTLTVTAGGFTLTINIVGQGTVTRNPDLTSYEPGAVVSLQAVPTAGWSFCKWAGAVSGRANPVSITMDGNKTVTVTFLDTWYTLTTGVMGHGWIERDPDQAVYAPGTAVQLTACPSEDWQFEGWMHGLSGSANPATVFMYSDKFVTAFFQRQEYTLTVNIVGQGIVTRDPDYNKYVEDQVVILTAIPSPGWSFSKWSGNHGYGDGDIDEVQLPVTMSTNRTVTVTFVQGGCVPIIKIAGQGSVTKNPNQASYTPGSQFQVTATPYPGWGFARWTSAGNAILNDPFANPATITINGGATITGSYINSNQGRWQTLNPSTSPTARSGQSMTRVCDKLILFGGKNGVLNDTWEWERIERNWRKITCINDPPARYNHSAAASNCKLYIFFGVNVNNEELSDVWSYNPATKTWDIENCGGDELPSGRYGQTTVTTEEGNITLFGGQKSDGPADKNLWTYDPSTKNWTKRATMPGAPRYGHGAAVYGGNLYVFGGKVPDGFSNEMWKYVPQTDTWQLVNVSGEKPSPRAKHGTAYWGNLLWVFGGENETSGIMSDTWEFDFLTYKWKKLPDMPQKRTDDSIVAFACESIDILIFGGLDNNFQRTDSSFLFEIKEGTVNCFIATASYGTSEDENLVPLRAFRDNVLAETVPGRAFVAAYYASSPPVAAEIDSNEALRLVVRWMLVTPATFLARIFSSVLSFIMLGVVLVGMGILSFRNRPMRTILIALGAGTLTAMVLAGLVLLGGSLANSVSWSAVVAAWMLPLILPLSMGAGIGVLIHRKN